MICVVSYVHSRLLDLRAINFVIVVASLLLTPAVAGPIAPATVRGVQIELRLNKATYAAREPIEITLTLSNPGTSAVKFQFSTGQMYDFIVSRDGQFVWQWSLGRAFTQAFTALILAPRESKVFTERWDQRDARGRAVPPGEHEIVAGFPAGDATVDISTRYVTHRHAFGEQGIKFMKDGVNATPLPTVN